MEILEEGKTSKQIAIRALQLFSLSSKNEKCFLLHERGFLAKLLALYFNSNDGTQGSKQPVCFFRFNEALLLSGFTVFS